MNSTSSNQTEWLFNSNFKIGRKNVNDDSNPGQNSTFERTTLDDAYDPCVPNIQRYPLANKRTFPQSDYDDLLDFNDDPSQSYSAPSLQANPVSLPFNQNVFHVNQPTINPLKRTLEVAKNSSSTKYIDSFPHRGDPSLPKELTEQFQPLYCKLCNAQLSSNAMAKLHYKSKNHEKKIRKFLVEYSERTGEPLHVRALVNGGKKMKLEEDNDPKFFHCDVCDLPLTGRLHAESHYMGRNHQKAMAGKAPAGKGHFNNEGKWVRNTLPTAVTSGRDTFGLDFVAPTEFVPLPDPIAKKLHCEMCDVKVTSEQQMDLHISGHKHKKRLLQQINDIIDADIQGDPENNILSTLSSNIVPSGDLSVYRTPTGYYYCNPCNLTLNSEIQFKQHLGSKKHRKKASGSKE